MSTTLPFDPLLLLLDDPALLEALMAGADPELASPVAAPVPPDAPAPAPETEPPATPAPEDGFPTTEELDVLLSDSYAPEPALDAATRAELIDAFGLDPALIDDEAALVAALAALEPLPEEDVSELIGGEPSWDLSWSETVLEDWALG